MNPPKNKYVKAYIAQDLCFDYVLKPLREEVEWVSCKMVSMLTEFELYSTPDQRAEFFKKHGIKDVDGFKQKYADMLKKRKRLELNLERAEEKYKRLTAIKQQLGKEMEKYFRDEMKKTA